MFAGGCGVTVLLDDLGEGLLPALFAEELGAVLQVRARDRGVVLGRLVAAGLGECSHVIGAPNGQDRLILRHAGETVILPPVAPNCGGCGRNQLSAASAARPSRLCREASARRLRSQPIRA